MSASKALAESLAGSVGGLLATAVIYPLDLVKTRLQTRQGSRNDREWLLDLVRSMVQQNGIQGLYQGLYAKALSCFYDDLVYFFVYGYFKDKLTKTGQDVQIHHLSIRADFASGCLAGLLQFAMTSPVETICTVMQADQTNENSPISYESSESSSQTLRPLSYLSAIRLIYEQNGFAGFWRGYVLSVLLTVNPAINFMTYEYLKSAWTRIFSRFPQTRHLRSTEAFAIGIVSKIFAVLLTYPLIRLKILSQAMAVKRYQGAFFVLMREVVRRHGWHNLYQGLVMQLVRSSIAAGIMAATREKARDLILRLLKS